MPRPEPSGMDLDRLTLSSPDAAIAAVPYLLGFHPHESAVLLWMRQGRLLLTQRLDLPASDLPDAGCAAAWLDAVWAHCAAATASEVIVVLFAHQAPQPWLVDGLHERAESAATTLVDLIVTEGGSWRSLLCTSDRCCPPEGRPVDGRAALAVAAEFAAVGRAPKPGRDDLEREFLPDPQAQASAAARLVRTEAAAPRDAAALEGWRDHGISAITAVLLHADRSSVTACLSADDVPLVVCGLRDIRVRDTVLWELSRSTDSLLTLERLAVAVRAAPSGYVAPVATVAGIVAWCAGDGARARMAVERALDDQPDYSLARLVATALDTGLPPERWRESMDQLTREECRRAA